jgi:manganese/iron transport system permease protein/iron/zinc/copper transport system permease protein
MQILGVTLIAASLIIPPTIARLLTDSFHKMVLYSILLGIFSSVFGIYMSFEVDVSSGASIVIVAAILFMLVFGYGGLKARFFKVKPQLDRLDGEGTEALATAGVALPESPQHAHLHEHRQSHQHYHAHKDDHLH